MALRYADWARLVSLTAGIWSTWAAVWGIFFRKFFFDMIGGELGPAGLIPPKSSAFFIKIIVDIPLVQIFTIIGGLFVLAFDWPLPFLEKIVFSRSPIFKMAFHFMLGFLSLLLYQAFDSAFVSFLALAIYAKSYGKGEHLRTESRNRNGSGGGEA